MGVNIVIAHAISLQVVTHFTREFFLSKSFVAPLLISRDLPGKSQW